MRVLTHSIVMISYDLPGTSGNITTLFMCPGVETDLPSGDFFCFMASKKEAREVGALAFVCDYPPLERRYGTVFPTW